MGSYGFRAPHRFWTRRGDGFRVVRVDYAVHAKRDGGYFYWRRMGESLADRWMCDCQWRATLDGGALLSNVLGVVDDLGINDPALTLN